MQFNNLITHLQSVFSFKLWHGHETLFKKELKGVTASSKDVKEGFIFVAIKGAQVDGENFIPAAIQAGATIIVTTKKGYDTYRNQCPHITFIETENPKLCLSKLASLFYPGLPPHIVAVTGTNGKSSTVDFTRQLWEHLGYKAASMGTLGIQSTEFKAEKHLTTPDPVYLHQNMQTLHKRGITHVAIEASSHGLDQYRLDGLSLKAAGITSFSRDHLDYHHTMENYLLAKGRLFSELLHASHGVAVLNADMAHYPAFQKLSAGLKVFTYGQQGEDLKITHLKPLPHGQEVHLSVFGKPYEIHFGLMGEFQLYNALCALGFVLADPTVDPAQAVRGLSTLKAPAGRLEFVAFTKNQASVYVDYAHAEDAIHTVLQALRKHTHHDLWIVFGAGGGRDPGTRPPMGKAAAQAADHVILTDDNPRFEDPDKIRAQLKKGAPNALEIPNRHKAIAYVIEHAQKGDIILVAGKGPEDGQIIQGKTEPFLDSAVILETIKKEVKDEK